jgi:hypothetical protein
VKALIPDAKDDQLHKPMSSKLQGPSFIDLTFDENQVIDLDEEEQKKDLGAPQFLNKSSAKKP